MAAKNSRTRGGKSNLNRVRAPLKGLPPADPVRGPHQLPIGHSMRDLLKRVERLEATSPMEGERVRIAVQFIAPGGGASNPQTACRPYGLENKIHRRASEHPDEFLERAFEHFAELDPSPSPLILLM